ncbi:MAG: PGPGW domain-containing protein, partial [bacterium]|nr:PGPGW domain-containing protein [bacterium]
QRSLFFAIRDLRPSIKYLKVGLAIMLGHCAVAVSLPPESRLAPEVFLIVVTLAATLGFLLAARYRQVPDPAEVSPLGPDAERLARFTLKQARKIVVLVIGLTLVGIGIAMIVLPGPAVVVIPLGLAFLASEFLWARRLLKRYTGHAQTFADGAQRLLVKKPRPKLVPVALVLTFGTLIAVCLWSPWPYRTVLLVASPVVAFVMLWAFSTLRAAYAKPRPPVSLLTESPIAASPPARPHDLPPDMR